jgi:hypothetical protein
VDVLWIRHHLKLTDLLLNFPIGFAKHLRMAVFEIRLEHIAALSDSFYVVVTAQNWIIYHAHVVLNHRLVCQILFLRKAGYQLIFE